MAIVMARLLVLILIGFIGGIVTNLLSKYLSFFWEMVLYVFFAGLVLYAGVTELIVSEAVQKLGVSPMGVVIAFGLVWLAIGGAAGTLVYRHYSVSEATKLPSAPFEPRPTWVTAHVLSHVPTASGIVPEVVLIADLSAQINVASIKVRCLVTAPDGRAYWGGQLEAKNVTSVRLHQNYPRDFTGAPPLAPGLYRVEWMGESNWKDVIARDSFEFMPPKGEPSGSPPGTPPPTISEAPPILLVQYNRERQFLPISVPAHSTAYLLNLNPNLDPRLSWPLAITAGETERKWPENVPMDPKGPFPDRIYDYEVTNQGDKPVLDVSITFPTFFYQPIRVPVTATRKPDGLLHFHLDTKGAGVTGGMVDLKQYGPKKFVGYAAGQLVKSVERVVTIPVIAPNKSVHIYVVSQSTLVVGSVTPTKADGRIADRATRISFELIHPKVDVRDAVAMPILGPSAHPWKGFPGY